MVDRAEEYELLYAQTTEDYPVEHRLVTCLAYLGNYSFDKILDIGCGDGGSTLLIAKAVKAREVKGIEISHEGASIAKGRGIDCVAIDTDTASVLPFESERFDFIFCGELIEHVFDTDRLIEYAFRLLKPGGKLLITTPNLASWHSRISWLLGYNPVWCSVSMKNHQAGKFMNISSDNFATRHIRFFTLRSLKELLVLNQFKVVKVFGFYAKPNVGINQVLSRLIYFIEVMCSLLPSFATQIGLVCEKPCRE